MFEEELLKKHIEQLQKGIPYTWLNAQAKNKPCYHIWEYDGHGHNYSVYKCTICGEEGEY